MSAWIRRSDVLWLRLAAWQDPPFGEGVPQRLAPTRFAHLQSLGLVELVTSEWGTRAVATAEGRARIEALREKIARRQAESGQGISPAATDERAEGEGNGASAGDRLPVGDRPLCQPPSCSGATRASQDEKGTRP